MGEKAKRQAAANPDRTIVSIKREMGSAWVKRIDGVEYRPQTVSAILLMQLKEDAERFLGQPVTEAVITVPAYFNDIQLAGSEQFLVKWALQVKRKFATDGQTNEARYNRDFSDYSGDYATD